ncbi:MAG: amino acid adenylation domain-containing protein [Candidatus Aminicenantes bacterium]|nr:amino acid adenylation domain-containing protein [Candidatus Aminicenantes bacterium]
MSEKKKDNTRDEKIMVLLDKFEDEKNYWFEKLQDITDIATFPVDFENRQENKKETLPISFDSRLASKILQIGKNNDLSIYVVLLAAFNVLAWKYSRLDDCIIASPMHVKDEKIYNRFILLRNTVAARMSFVDHIMAVKATVSDGYKNQHYPISKVIETLGYGDREFIAVAVALEGVHKIDTLDAFTESAANHLLLSFVRARDKLAGKAIYNSKLFKENTVRGIVKYYITVLDWLLANPKVQLSELELATPGEKEVILNHFNQAEVEFPGPRTIHELFEAAAARWPGNISVIFEDQPVKYTRLNEDTNRWARFLAEKGIRPGSIAAIMLESSVEMVTVILAILKSGGAYLPLQPDYPAQRIKHMLEDSGAQLLLTISSFSGLLQEIQPGIPAFFIDKEDLTPYSTANIDAVGDNMNLAYIIYTSGTTGAPKGVLVQNKGLVNYTLWRLHAYNYTCKDVSLQLLSYIFDGFMSNFYTSLLSGGTLVMVPGTRAVDTDYLKEIIKKYGVTNISLVPGMYKTLLDKIDGQYLTSMRFVVLAGEKADSKLISRSREKIPGILHIIEYGPTEATVTAIANIGIEPDETALIGKPIANVRVYILDEWFKLLPVGIAGEIFIGGCGVALGYLNNDELTSKRFIENPFEPGGKLYRTGDLARWTGDGKIEFIGRVDRQLKVGGIRVELEEIKNCLLTHDDILEAEVMDGENREGEKYLYACVVCRGSIPESELRGYLGRYLPHYMLPSKVIYIDKMPLTPNGKPDRKALEEIGQKMCLPVEYSAPQNIIEKNLVEVWEEVLGRESIGIGDNFFLLGGDSIKTIQIAAKMNSRGYRIGMKEIFENPTITQLAPLVEELQQTAEQSLVTGIIPLIPIQRSFFSGPPVDRHHFNQAVLLYSKDGFDEVATRVVFQKIQEHHDALRMNYINRDGEISQVNRGLDYPFSLQVFDCRDRENAFQILEDSVEKIQGSIDLENGPVMKLGLFHMNDGDCLLIVIHHLVIDTVSWRILFEDIDSLYKQYHLHHDEKKLALPYKTDSFKIWAQKLAQYASSLLFLKEKNYWKELEAIEVPRIAKDYEIDDNFLKDFTTLSFRLSETETEYLLTKVNNAFNTEINDVLLTALGLAFSKTLGHKRVLIALEGHGREEILKDVNIKRTVGWFTSMFPVALNFTFETDFARQLKEVKETLRRIPNKGIGYGILKYLSPGEYKREIDFKLKPQVSFNYFGQFTADLANLAFTFAKEGVGHTQSLDRESECQLDVVGMIAENYLEIGIAYNMKHYKTETIAALVNAFHEELRRVISFCMARESVDASPSDFSYKKLSIDELDSIFDGIEGKNNELRKENIKDIYPLSSMQEGMFFHAMFDRNSIVYFLQVSYRLFEEIDIRCVEKTINELFKRYDILRTVFIQKGSHRPLQVVLKERAFSLEYEDISGADNNMDDYLTRYKEKDLSGLFNLEKDLLIRVAVIKSGPAVYDFVWSFHHILMDGWCIGLLISEYFEIYQSFVEKRPYHLPKVTPYRTFIEWLEKQDHEASKQYWSDYLEGYTEQVGVPRLKGIKTRQKGYKIEVCSHPLEKDKTNRVNQMAKNFQVTTSTFFQAVWGIILEKFNNKHDVVFGAVVSGRPPEIEGVENILGSFMATIPIRIKNDENTAFSSLIRDVQESALKSQPHHHYPLAEIQANSHLKQNLFDHIFVFENFPRLDAVSKLSDVKPFEQSNYSLNFIIVPGESLNLIFTYNGNLYDANFIKNLAGQIEKAVDIVLENENIKVKDITISQIFLTAASNIHADKDGDFDI